MLSTIYALLCIIVPCSLYQLIICKRQNKKQENKVKCYTNVVTVVANKI